MHNSSFRAGRRRPAGARGAATHRPHFQKYNQKPRAKGRSQYINPEKFINKAVTVEAEAPYEPTHLFTDFAFDNELQHNIAARGFTQPSPIQDQSIPEVLAGKDLIGLANTGTGKTAAFVLPIIQRLLTLHGRQPVRALIVAPTRELAVQIDDQFRAFARGLRLYSSLCVGGVNIQRQIHDLYRHPHVVIGTPGRLKDLINRQALKLGEVQVVVLDEADQMLDMGFIADIKFLIAQLPAERQSLCFSATITPPIRQLMTDLLKEPVTVSVRTGETSEHVEQNIVKTHDKEHKIQTLRELLAKPEFEKVLVFGETKWGVQRLAETLSKGGIPSEAIHGNKSQPQRQRALRAFTKNDVRVLVATDVAARGLDIPNVSHVINFDQPATYQDYVHRIGRTGRGGKRGHALTFVSK